MVVRLKLTTTSLESIKSALESDASIDTVYTLLDTQLRRLLVTLETCTKAKKLKRVDTNIYEGLPWL